MRKKEAKKSTKVLLKLGLIIVLIVIFFLASSAITKYTGYLVIGEKDETERGICLKQQDITLYINSEDTGKTLSAIGLEYLEYVKIMNCIENKKFCSSKGVDAFPTWIINNERIKGDFEELLEHTEC